MKPEALDLLTYLHGFLARENVSGQRVTVGLSGGVDSMVLLDCLGRLRGTLPLQLSAVHVNHGLSPNAAHWAKFCVEQAGARAIPLDVIQVQVQHGSGASVEAEARKARFEVLSKLDTDVLSLAHHLDDQAETLLLQLLRGAGPKGLASMARSRNLTGNIRLLRPFLEVSRARILAYAHDAALRWIEDESNRDVRFDRNFLRARVFPVLERRYPGYRENLARSAKNMLDLDEVAGALGRLDLSNLSEGGGIAVARLRELSEPRAINALRSALQQHGADMPARERLRELLRQACNARRDGSVRVELGRRTGQIYRGNLYFTETRAKPLPWKLEWNGQNQVQLPDGQGRVQVTRVQGRGLCSRVSELALYFCNRSGGERIQLHPRQPHKTLTHLFQRAAVPPWERACMPLLKCEDDVLWVPGLGYAANYQTTADEEGVELAWHASVPERKNTSVNSAAR